jgi:hypothetical protein
MVGKPSTARYLPSSKDDPLWGFDVYYLNPFYGITYPARQNATLTISKTLPPFRTKEIADPHKLRDVELRSERRLKLDSRALDEEILRRSRPSSGGGEETYHRP